MALRREDLAVLGKARPGTSERSRKACVQIRTLVLVGLADRSPEAHSFVSGTSRFVGRRSSREGTLATLPLGNDRG